MGIILEYNINKTQENLTPLVLLSVVREKMSTCPETCKKSCEKGSNYYCFGSACHLSALGIKLDVRMSHLRDDLTKLKGQAKFSVYMQTVKIFSPEGLSQKLNFYWTKSLRVDEKARRTKSYVCLKNNNKKYPCRCGQDLKQHVHEIINPTDEKKKDKNIGNNIWFWPTTLVRLSTFTG